jgi:DNA-binding MarR family transcriptional regulator
MPGVEHSDQDKPTLLEMVLRVQGDFRRCLEPIGVTPLQAGVMRYLQRHPDAKMKDTAAGLDVRSPTLTDVIDALVRKRLMTTRRALHDTRTLCLRLSRQGEVVARKIKDKIRDVRSDLPSVSVPSTC